MESGDVINSLIGAAIAIALFAVGFRWPAWRTLLVVAVAAAVLLLVFAGDSEEVSRVWALPLVLPATLVSALGVVARRLRT
jgi:hypothetical protein